MVSAESQVPISERYLMIEGGLSRRAKRKLRSALPTEAPATRTLFVGLAYADIPLGTTFDTWWSVQNPLAVIFARTVVEAVTQQFRKPFNCVPHGSKTVTTFRFLDDVPDVVDALPTLDRWTFAPQLGLSTRDTWQAQTTPE